MTTTGIFEDMAAGFDCDFTGSVLEPDINQKEVKSVIDNINSRLHVGNASLYMIGYSYRKRIIGVYFDYNTNIKHIRVLKAILPNEKNIKDFYCK